MLGHPLERRPQLDGGHAGRFLLAMTRARTLRGTSKKINNGEHLR